MQTANTHSCLRISCTNPAEGLRTGTVTQLTQTSLLQPVAWFCVQTQPKHEHIAAAQLRQDSGLEVFLPRIRYQRSTRFRRVWVTEALFANYVFARFNLTCDLRRVQTSRGVRSVVHFGSGWPAIPDTVINDLQASLGPDEVKLLSLDLEVGDAVEISHGAFHGLEAVVTRVLPGRERVAILLDFLGRQTALELDRSHLLAKRELKMLSELASTGH